MDENIVKVRMESNVKLYQKYKIFAYDVLFYYAISILFLTEVKGFSIADVLFLSSIFSVFSTMWQLVSNLIIEKIGLKFSVILGNILCVIMMVLYILSPTFILFALGQLFGSLGFSLKSISESTILYESLKRLGKEKSFTKDEGKANSKYYYAEALASIAAGYLFLVNGYLPVILALLCCIVSLVMSFKFYHTKNNTAKQIKISEYLDGFKMIIKSDRSKSILLLAFIITGITMIAGTMYKAIFIDYGFTADILAYVACGYSILSGIGARLEHRIESKTKNVTLTVFLITFTSALAVIGLIGLTAEVSNVFVLTTSKLIIVSLALVAMALIQGAYRVAIKKYVISFTTNEIRTKITSLYYMFEGIGSALMLFIGGLLLGKFTNSISTLLLSFGTLIIGAIALIYAKSRLGLKPEEYQPKDINYIEVGETLVEEKMEITEDVNDLPRG